MRKFSQFAQFLRQFLGSRHEATCSLTGEQGKVSTSRMDFYSLFVESSILRGSAGFIRVEIMVIGYSSRSYRAPEPRLSERPVANLRGTE